MVEKAGDLLTALLGQGLMTKARGYTDLFSSWRAVTEEERAAAAADHSRIAELEHGVIFVEADHPGWIQVLQLKQRKLLSSLQRKFPDMGISGICFRLSRRPAERKVPPPEET
jgi:predicted nucleic acid-binding Zn ribbon protein